MHSLVSKQNASGKEAQNITNKETKIELLVMKTIMPMMKTSLYGIDNRLHPEEEKIRELKGIKGKPSKMKQKKKNEWAQH